jgi:protein subunit release factor A
MKFGFSKFRRIVMETIIVELRAAEGGEDSKLLVMDQLRTYVRVCMLHGL